MPLTKNSLTMVVAAAALTATALFVSPIVAQEVDPEIEAAYDTAEMRQVVDEVGRMSVPDHAALIDRLRARLDTRLLTPDPDTAARYSEFAGRTDAGVAKIVTRGMFEGRTRVSGGGAYFSFVTGSNDYDRSADVELQQGRFSSGFAGGDCGLVYPIDAQDVRSVTESDVPELLRGDPYAVNDRDRKSFNHPEAADGQVYAIRSIHWDAHDTLATFQVISMDEYGVTIAWRRLRSYEAPVHPRRRDR